MPANRRSSREPAVWKMASIIMPTIIAAFSFYPRLMRALEEYLHSEEPERYPASIKIRIIMR